jgi:hypothetical protein
MTRRRRNVVASPRYARKLASTTAAVKSRGLRATRRRPSSTRAKATATSATPMRLGTPPGGSRLAATGNEVERTNSPTNPFRKTRDATQSLRGGSIGDLPAIRSTPKPAPSATFHRLARLLQRAGVTSTTRSASPG